MVDFAGIAGGLELLRDQIEGDDIQPLGNASDLGWPAAMAAMQARVAAGAPASEFANIDYAGLPGAIVKLEQGITSTLDISGTPVTSATVDVAYTGFTVTGSGGAGGYVYSVYSGTLPDGITLNASTGAVAGTPTVEDTFTDIILRVTDVFGDHADLAPFSIEVTAGGGGTLPLDVATNALVAYSLRALATPWNANVVTLRRDSDDTEMSFVASAASAVDVAAVTTFLSGADGFFVELVDQSGNANDISQDTPAAQPAWLASAVNGVPGVDFSTGTTLAPTWLYTETPITLTDVGYTAFVVVKANSNTAKSGALSGINFETGSGDFAVEFTNNHIPGPFFAADPVSGPPGPSVFGTSSGTVAVGDYFIYEGAMDAAAGEVLYNGDGPIGDFTAAGDPPIGDITGVLAIGVDDAGSPSGYWLDGVVCEYIVWNRVLTTEERDAVRQNIADYYDITLA